MLSLEQLVTAQAVLNGNDDQAAIDFVRTLVVERISNDTRVAVEQAARVADDRARQQARADCRAHNELVLAMYKELARSLRAAAAHLTDYELCRLVLRKQTMPRKLAITSMLNTLTGIHGYDAYTLDVVRRKEVVPAVAGALLQKLRTTYSYAHKSFAPMQREDLPLVAARLAAAKAAKAQFDADLTAAKKLPRCTDGAGAKPWCTCETCWPSRNAVDAVVRDRYDIEQEVVRWQQLSDSMSLVAAAADVAPDAQEDA